MSLRIRIGTRGSALARAQAAQVAQLLVTAHPHVETHIEIIKTTGDQLKATALEQLAGETKGLFVKEIEEALLQHRVDLAVHSLKDLPGEMAPGLSLGAVPKREDPRDALIFAHPDMAALHDLPAGASVATGSPRRRAQLLEARPDLQVVGIRGNVGTRLRRLREGPLDALVLATAGLNRLNLADQIDHHLDPEVMTPAVGQGALGLQVRDDDSETKSLVSVLDHEPTRLCIEAERWLQAQMGGGCQLPLGAFATTSLEGDTFQAFWSDPGASPTRYSGRGPTGSLPDLSREALLRLSPMQPGQAP